MAEENCSVLNQSSWSSGRVDWGVIAYIKTTLITSNLQCNIIVLDIIIIIVWLVLRWTLPFLRACSMLVDSAFDDIQLPDQCWELCQIWFNGPEPGVAWSAWSAVPVPWQRDHTGPKGSTVVHGWIGASSAAKELQTSGTDDVCEWWLVSASADLFVRNADTPRNS